MALIDKDIVITPNKGSSAADPNIVFTSDANSSITVTLTSSNGGTLSFAGSIGALLNLVNTSVGTLFGVNDGSGIPSLEVVDDGTVRSSVATLALAQVHRHINWTLWALLDQQL